MRSTPARFEAWKQRQSTEEGVPRKPGEPPKGEVRTEGHVPPEAIEGPAARFLRGTGRVLMLAAVVSTAIDLFDAFRKGIEQGSGWPIAREVVRQATTWGMAIAMAGDGAAVGGVLGNFIGGPPGPSSEP